MKSSRGFTIVELLVVIIVISILATVSVVVFNSVQQQTRDLARKSDMVVLTNSFEKYYATNGFYPSGCSWSSSASGCTINGSGTTPVGDIGFYFSSTRQSILSSLNLRDDAITNKKSNPFSWFNNTSDTKNSYFYWGQLENTGTTPENGQAISYNIPYLTCDPSVTIFRYSNLPPNGNSFILGYFGESDNKWHIYQGNSGRRLTNVNTNTPIRSTTIGQCIFEN